MRNQHNWLGHFAALQTGALLLLSFPVLTQGQQDPSRWEKDIAAFETADQTNAPPKNAVLFVGSSSIRLWNTLATDFEGVQVIQRGFGGSQMEDVLAFTDRIVLPYEPRSILVYEGDNDIASGKSPEQILRDYQMFVARVQPKLPRTRIGYIAIKPSLKRWHLVDQIRAANGLIRDYSARDDRLEFIDIFTPMLGSDGTPRKELFIEDGLHMNEKGYRVWTEVIKNRHAKLLD